MLRFPIDRLKSIEVIGFQPLWHKEYAEDIHASPEDYLDDVIQQAKTSRKDITPNHSLASVFDGGLIGYLGYEFGKIQVIGRHSDRKEECVGEETSTSSTSAQALLPAAYIAYFDQYLVVDHSRKLISGVVDSVTAKQIINLPANNCASLERDFSFRFTPFLGKWSFADYQKAFHKLQDYIYSGDTYQVNLTHRFQANYKGNLWSAFQQVDRLTLAPHAAFISTCSGQILSFSPENFLSINQGKISTKPIKGTRPRHTNPAIDTATADELQQSQKDRAENVMIVDLLRNDLGKLAKTGTVTVNKLCALESFSNVHHLVSTVTADLQDDVHPLKALLHCSPGGSITGAPKKRAIEIINELEPHPRDIYCGSIFFCGNNGRLESNIAIRTLACRDGVANLWGGGGVVADSECLSEFNESLVKIRHIAQALGVDIDIPQPKNNRWNP